MDCILQNMKSKNIYFYFTWEVQVFQAGAAGHQLKHSLIRDIITASNLQVT